ncbi:hypothetical protein QN224_26970 [Sinorhizobium sp. 8-89]|uniref:hypothetical protein n=1 Tax=Sinorhizobium sp. 7-81 TaxID=3049087 RepID=UPI0024C27EC4|nr:hypothetical protein [Sinorhizobium sp. 7-81]MDK1389051.1 hypothetical protein [Sinorhizobium sp. 7-81]
MGMFRITLQKMLILIRLAIVVSLAGYSVPTASAATHGAWPDLEISQSVHQHHEVASGDHLHGDHDQSSPDDAQKLAKTDCCQGFCFSMAIVTDANPVGGPRVASIREFVDDAQATGKLPTLHRPPNI